MGKRALILLMSALLFATLPGAAQASAGEEKDGIIPGEDCVYRMPEGREDAQTYLSDGDLETRLTLTPKQSMTLTWQGEAAGVMIFWYEPAGKATLEWLDADGNVIGSEDADRTCYRQWLTANGASGLTVTCVSGQVSMCEVHACTEAYTPDFRQGGQGQADILLVLSGMMDETHALGGLLPQYTVENGVTTAIVYLGKDYGYLVQEGLAALTSLGITCPPQYQLLDDQNAVTVCRVASLWNDGVLKKTLYALIRAVRPKIIVTVDPGEDSPVRAQYTAQTVQAVVQTMAKGDDADIVSKLYVLDAAGGTVVDWTRPLSCYDGLTAQQAAQRAYDSYTSQAMFERKIEKQTAFRLVYTAVGEDTACNDLLEHIDTSTLLNYREPTPLPTPTPTPTQTPAPTAEPAVTPTLTPAATAAAAARDTDGQDGARPRAALMTAGIILAALGLLGGAWIILAGKTTGRRRVLLLLAAALLLAVGILLAILAKTRKASGPDTTQTLAATTEAPVPSETPTPVPTPAPTPTPEPTPTPDPNEGYYRQEGEPEEVIVVDYDKGHWEYRTDTLSILIDREEYTLEKDGGPRVRYVAHIRMRGVDCFRAGVSSNLPGADLQEPPFQIARGYRAVLAITGDNLTNADVAFKGILIRNGRYYADYRAEDALVFNPDLTLAIIKKGTLSGLQLVDSGVKNAFSFGPTLVDDGRINELAAEHRIAILDNPRCGIGMVEQGHFVAIVTDGRDIKRAWNVNMMDFAQMFLDEDCTVAYNLDGGSSAAMVFMGEHLNCHSGEADLQREWTDALLWGYSEQVPDIMDPLLYPGQ